MPSIPVRNNYVNNKQSNFLFAGFSAEGVPIKWATTLQDFTKMITINGVLYDGQERVRAVLGIDAATRDADSLGPPLDIDEPKSDSEPQPPAPPTNQQLLDGLRAANSKLVSPPAPPTPEELAAFRVSQREDPPVGAGGQNGPIGPPAPPTPEELAAFRVSQRAVLPVGAGGQNGPIGPPAPPTPEELAAFRVSQRDVPPVSAGDPIGPPPQPPQRAQKEDQKKSSNSIAKVRS